jgi:protease II
MLDANELAKGEKFLSVGRTEVSDDGHLLAFATDTTGFREYVLSVKDLRTGKLLGNQARQGRLVRVGGGQQDAVLRHRGPRQAARTSSTGTSSANPGTRTLSSTRRRTSCTG